MFEEDMMKWFLAKSDVELEHTYLKQQVTFQSEYQLATH